MKKSFYLSSLLVFCFILSSVASRAQAPVITADPHDTTVCTGSTTRFITHSTGATSKMWQVWNLATWDTVHNGGIYSGATSDTLMVTTSMALNGYMYRSIVFGTPGSDTTAAATLTVDTLRVGVISDPGMLCVGSTTTLTNTEAGGTWSRLHPAVDTIVATTGELTALAFGFDTVRYTVSGGACGTGFSSLPIRVDTVMVALPISGPALTCIGGTILLTNPNVLGIHTWTPSNGNATIAPTGFLTGAAAGFDTITYSIINGCNAVSSDYVVQIDAPLTSGTITGPTVLCYASSIHLTSSVSGGTWVSSNSGVATVDGSGNVTGVSQGTVLISYFRSNGCGSFVTTHNDTVYAPVAPIMGIDSVGVDSTRILTDTTWGMSTSWSSSDTTIAKFDSAGVVRGVAVGTATVTYSVTNVCGTSFATLLIHVGNPPSAGAIYTVTGPGTIGKDTVCMNGTVMVADSTAQAPGVWNIVHGKATVDPTGLVHGVTRGKDTVVYTVTNAFGSTKATKTITIYSAKVDSVKGPATIALGGAYTMQGYPAGGKWTSNNDTAATIINPATGFFVVVDYGSAIFTYTIHSALCGDSSMTYLFNFPQPEGVTAMNNAAGDLKVYPNPAKGTFTVNLASDITTSVNVVITNVVGAKVKEFTTTTNHSTSVQLDQPAGMYFITASTEAGSYTTKIMIAE